MKTGKKQKKDLTLTAVAIIIAAVIIIFCGVIFYQYSLTITPPVVQTQQTPPVQQPQQPQNQTDQTAGWQTFSRDGISFKYPAEMGQPVVNELSMKTLTSIIFKNSVSITVGYYGDTTFDQAVSSAVNNPDASQVSRKNITVGGKDGVELDFMSKISGGEMTQIFIPIDNAGNILIASEYNRGISVAGGAGLDEILPTLKFIPVK